jgi:hypothetical protein
MIAIVGTARQNAAEFDTVEQKQEGEGVGVN